MKKGRKNVRQKEQKEEKSKEGKWGTKQKDKMAAWNEGIKVERNAVQQSALGKGRKRNREVG